MKTLLFAITVHFLLSSFLLAQEKVDIQMIQKIKDEELQHSQIEMLSYYLTDICGPRLTNSPGYRRAVAWAAQTLKQWGLQNAAPEPWGEFGRGWSNEESYLAMKVPYYQPIIAYPFAWSKSTPGLISAKVLLLDKLDSASIDKLGIELKGCIVMAKSSDTVFLNPFKADAYRYVDSDLNKLPDNYLKTHQEFIDNKKLVKNIFNANHYLQSKGALALLTFSGGGNGTVRIASLISYANLWEPTIPQMTISKEDFFRIQRLLTHGESVILEMNVQNKFYTDDLTGYNVIAEIPGTDPVLKDQIVMLGGHLDSWHISTGATDDAAGCIVMMEAVRVLKSIGVKPRRTIRIALWGAEEQGLVGSYGYVKTHFGNSLDMTLKPEQEKVSVYFNLDNGTGKIRGIYLQNNVLVRDIFIAWLQPFSSMGATGITISNSGSTDHLSFDAVGIPAFQFIQDPLEYKTRTLHTNMDEYDHLFMEDLKQSATIVAAFVYNASMRDEMLPRKPLPKPEQFVFENGMIK
jgi:carboxypeptidase Q